MHNNLQYNIIAYNSTWLIVVLGLMRLSNKQQHLKYSAPACMRECIAHQENKWLQTL